MSICTVQILARVLRVLLIFALLLNVLALLLVPASVMVNAPVGHSSTQAPQPMHFFLVYSFSARGEMPSGLWHHTQASGHPFMKIVTRMPGPSFIAYRLISNNSMAQKVSCSVRAITSACKSAFISLK